jgi:hypothetical protein
MLIFHEKPDNAIISNKLEIYEEGLVLKQSIVISKFPNHQNLIRGKESIA